jgi:hypothetical protein
MTPFDPPTERAEPGMKTLMNTHICLALVATFVTLTLVGPAAAQQPMPFLGSIQGEETAAFNADQSIRTVDGSGTGSSTLPHLRRLTVQWGGTVIAATGRGTEHFTFLAANGDSISTEALGYGEAIFPQPGPPTHIHVVEHHIITGGTGRFAGTTGSFTLDRVVDVSADPNPFSPGPFPVAGSFHGTITSRGAEETIR